jgi:hypothetical protein
VILIEHSSGVQVGRGNDQVSTYRVTLPRASFASADSLADTLLSPGAPWSGDMFSHDAVADLASAAGGGSGSSSGGIVQGPHGDTLVIVRNSRGVQAGNGNVQRNNFQVRASVASVRAGGLGMTASRQSLVSRLRENPGDHAAAQELADDIGQAARTSLEADLTVQVRVAAGNTQIPAWEGEFRDLTGSQIGGPGNHATIRVKVEVGKFDTTALARGLQSAAARLPRPPGSDRFDPDAKVAGGWAPTLTTPSRQSPGEWDNGRQLPSMPTPGRPSFGAPDTGGDAPQVDDGSMWSWVISPPTRPGPEGPGGR